MERVIDWYGYNETVLNPVALAFTLSCGLLALLLPKSRAMVPLLLVTCFLTAMQRLVVGGFDFTMLRILLLFYAIRVVFRSEGRGFHWDPVDRVVVLYFVVGTIAYTLLWGTLSAFVYRLGQAFDTLGVYLIARLLLRESDSFVTVTRTLCFAAVVIAVCMVLEHVTGRNMFSVFGGVSEFTPIREGRLRAQAAFSHPILAGTFGATLVPLLWGLWYRDRRRRGLVIVGTISCIVITIASSSSGPVFSLMGAIAGIMIWRLRHYVRHLVILGLVCYVALDIAMKAPVWHLLARIDIAGGSTGYHRYLLIDQTIRHFRSWMLVGVRSTASWGWGLQDLTNQFVLEAVTGGLATLVLFTMVIVMTFGRVAIAAKSRCFVEADRRFLWAIGACLFAHVVSFIGVSYFGQMVTVYYVMLAMGVSLIPRSTPQQGGSQSLSNVAATLSQNNAQRRLGSVGGG